MPGDTVATIYPADPWGDYMFLRDLRNRFGGNPIDQAQLTEEERARLERLNEKLKERHSWRRL